MYDVSALLPSTSSSQFQILNCYDFSYKVYIYIYDMHQWVLRKQYLVAYCPQITVCKPRRDCGEGEGWLYIHRSTHDTGPHGTGHLGKVANRNGSNYGVEGEMLRAQTVPWKFALTRT